MIQIFTLALAANEVREVSVTGEYFELRNALFPIALIELLDRNGAILSRLENPEQSDFVKPGNFQTVRITNGATAQTVKHFYGTGDAGSRRTSGLVRIDGSSDVSVIDGEKSRSLLGGAYEGAPGILAAAAVFPRAQLWNPAGSGKNLIVTDVAITTGVASGFTLYAKNTALATLVAGQTASKKLGAAVSLTEARVENAAASDVPAFGRLAVLTTAAGVVIQLRPKAPYVVPPGFGLSLEGSTQNVTLNSVFDWFEELI